MLKRFLTFQCKQFYVCASVGVLIKCVLNCLYIKQHDFACPLACRAANNVKMPFVLMTDTRNKKTENGAAYTQIKDNEEPNLSS